MVGAAKITQSYTQLIFLVFNAHASRGNWHSTFFRITHFYFGAVEVAQKRELCTDVYRNIFNFHAILCYLYDEII